MISNIKNLFHNIDKIFLKKISLTMILEQMLINNKLSILDIGAVEFRKNKFNYSITKFLKTK